MNKTKKQKEQITGIQQVIKQKKSKQYLLYINLIYKNLSINQNGLFIFQKIIDISPENYKLFKMEFRFQYLSYKVL